MRALKAKRALLKSALTRVFNFFGIVGAESPIIDWHCRLERLEEIWRDYMEIMSAMIEKCNGDDTITEEIEADSAVFESRVLTSRGKIRAHISSKEEQTPMPDVSQTESNIAVTGILSAQTEILSSISRQVSTANISFLPKLKIKPFSGELTEWKSFQDAFVSSIHNNSLYTPCQKFQLLKGYLEGQAYDIIGQIPESNENYLEAWEKLCNRYNKFGIVANTYVSKFLGITPISNQNTYLLRKVYDTVDEIIRGLRALGTAAENRDVWLLHILISKLDSNTTREWSKYSKSNEDFPTIDEFMRFLDSTCSSLEASSLVVRKEIKPIKSHQTLVEARICRKCDGSHELHQCENFLKLNTKLKREFVGQNHICFNCLREGHIAAKCRSKYKCRTCKKCHHTLLHDENLLTTNNTVNVNLNATHEIKTLLPTALCYVRDSCGGKQQCRLLLDSASEKTIISEKCIQRLGLKRMHAKVPLNGLDNISTGISQGWVSLNISPRFKQNESFEVGALIMPSISTQLPTYALKKEQYSSVLSLDLADPYFYVPSSIDILLGNDIFFEILQGEKIITNGIIAFKTTLGWILGGDLAKSENEKSVSVFCNNIDIDKTLSRFWETDEVFPSLTYTDEERGAEESFLQSFTRSNDGKFCVELPFKTKTSDYGGSFGVALKRFKATERRLSSNKELRTQYTQFINEYISLGHMQKIPQCEINKKSSECYYLPHHAVVKDDSTTTRLRVVFDGSAKNGLYPSLNETLFIGPSLLREIFAILCRFRRHKYVMSGDVEKMYRMIWIHDSHQDFQRILWRPSENQTIEHYRLKTVTYGTACAPFLAVRVLEELGKQSEIKHPKAAVVILKDFYMDDVITGAETIEELITTHKQLVSVLETAGMNLRKWSSNCQELLQSLPEHLTETTPLTFDGMNSLKLLGLKWIPDNDNFAFCISPSTSSFVTKQGLLSDAARIFDPLGFLTPSTTLIKIIFQKLWLTKLDWKDEIPSNIAEQWINLRDSLHKLNSLNIPRRIWYANGYNELYGLCDASQNAYAAVIYCRSEYNNGIATRFVAAKSRVAPLKEVSLPRLELCGALLLCRLMNNVLKALEMDSRNVIMWTDSSVVLYWLSSIPRRWSVYVANRTSEILSSYTRNHWRHIRSQDNPADPASRGVSPLKLRDLNLWWNGPVWISLPKSEWPNSVIPTTPSEQPLEERKKNYKTNIQVFFVLTENHIILGQLLKNISEWSRFVRSTAFCFRFIGLLKNRIFDKFLSSVELLTAKHFIFKIVQKEVFDEEISSLQNSKYVTKKSKLSSLSPFLDDSGLMRVGGRISNSLASFSIKHPIILPAKHQVTKMIARYIHITQLHVGVSQLIFLLRQEYWILGVRNLARRVVHECHRCFKLRKTTQTQFMSDLPVERVQFQRPFSKVGCDYAGPFMIKIVAGRMSRKTKGYIALFVCFITKAIHTELVGDLTSEAFIGALDRFISRRGKPVEIWSDNATNFVGAKRKIDEMQQILMNQKKDLRIADHLSQYGINWRFIPPASPHFGGIWESGVKSVKTHLKRVIGETALTYEHFYTLLTRIEALLNSRPMCPSNDGEIDALTPAHFLIGQPYTARSEPIVDTATNISPLKQWDKVKFMAQGFWKRWHNEYLTSLQQRQRWRIPQENIQARTVESELLQLKPQQENICALLLNCRCYLVQKDYRLSARGKMYKTVITLKKIALILDC